MALPKLHRGWFGGLIGYPSNRNKWGVQVTDANCPFCSADPSRLIFEEQLVFGLWDGYPVSPGHGLVIPKRHFPSWFEATLEEQQAVLQGVARMREEILRRYQPDGFNIGINVNE